MHLSFLTQHIVFTEKGVVPQLFAEISVNVTKWSQRIVRNLPVPPVEEFSPTLPLREVYRQTIPQSQKIPASPMKPRKGQNGAITFPKLSLCKIAALLKRTEYWLFTDSSWIFSSIICYRLSISSIKYFKLNFTRS